MSTDTKTAVVAAWRKMYKSWEEGEAVSPDARDLARAANAIDPTLPDDEKTADALWEAECDGMELEDAYDAVYG